MFHEIKQAPSLGECNLIKLSLSCLLCRKFRLWEMQPLFCWGGRGEGLRLMHSLGRTLGDIMLYPKMF